jgi:hypothetical protein
MKAGENSVPSRHGSRSWATGYDEEYLRESAQPVHRPRPQKCPPRSSARPFSPPAVPLLWCNPTTRELTIKTMIQTLAIRFSKKHARTKENRKKDWVEERGTATRRTF